MQPDNMNGVFELVGGVFVSCNVWRLYHDKKVRGVSMVAIAFFATWGCWNLYYYPSLDQWWSAVGALPVALATTFWLAQMIYYTRKEKQRNMRTIKTEAEFAMDLWRHMCGCPELKEKLRHPDLKDPKKLRADIEAAMAPFFRYMVNCIIIGSYRYEPLAVARQFRGKRDYMAYGKTKVGLWEQTGNDELLVDIANMAWLEFAYGGHPYKHLSVFTTPDHLRPASLTEYKGSEPGPKNKALDAWIVGSSGKKIKPYAMQPKDIDLNDIADALSRKARFSGHGRHFASVAQHCVMLARGDYPGPAIWRLFHDVSEAYLPDIVTPLKPLYPEHIAAEERILSAVQEHFGLPEYTEAIHREIKKGDIAIRAIEAHALGLSDIDAEWGELPKGAPVVWKPWSCAHARNMFVAVANGLLEELE